MLTNFTLQDLLGTSLAFFLFPLVFFTPGLLVGWGFNLFEFKQRSGWMQAGLAVILSFSISPILFFLGWRLISFSFTLGVFLVGLLAGGFIFSKICCAHRPKPLPNGARLALGLAGGWVLLALLSLVDLQLGERLYFSIVSLDYATRVAVVEAISRTGVPPINPSYFPEAPVQLTSLYYFWYVLVSVIDKIGLGWIDGREALIASAAWSGLGLMALIAVYLRLRAPENSPRAWRRVNLGLASLSLGGLDILPTLILLIASRLVLGKFFFDGAIEHWNEEIATWLTAFFWNPHHVASLIVCLTGLLLIQFFPGPTRQTRIAGRVVAGLAFASAFGLSVWTTLVFCAFLGVWAVYQLFIERKAEPVLGILTAGGVALLAAAPFISDLLGGLEPASPAGLSPLVFGVRKFHLLLPLTAALTPLWQNLLSLLFLPVNYWLELGCFFSIAFLWLKQFGPRVWRSQPFQTAEILLLGVTFLLASFVKSTVGNNDFGWRAWLFGQFVLLIWGTDLLHALLEKNPGTPLRKLPGLLARAHPLLALFFSLGLLTTLANALFLRTWPLAIDANLTIPYEINPDTHLGERTYAAKLAYRFVEGSLPLAATLQTNPAVEHDRPLGLYGNRQTAVSAVAPYGVASAQMQPLKDEIGPIFSSPTPLAWEQIDQICQRYQISLLVTNDLDPLWNLRKELETERLPSYQNRYYAVYPCGKAE